MGRARTAADTRAHRRVRVVLRAVLVVAVLGAQPHAVHIALHLAVGAGRAALLGLLRLLLRGGVEPLDLAEVLAVRRQQHRVPRREHLLARQDVLHRHAVRQEVRRLVGHRRCRGVARLGDGVRARGVRRRGGGVVEPRALGVARVHRVEDGLRLLDRDGGVALARHVVEQVLLVDTGDQAEGGGLLTVGGEPQRRVRAVEPHGAQRVRLARTAAALVRRRRVAGMHGAIGERQAVPRAGELDALLGGERVAQQREHVRHRARPPPLPPAASLPPFPLVGAPVLC